MCDKNSDKFQFGRGGMEQERSHRAPPNQFLRGRTRSRCVCATAGGGSLDRWPRTGAAGRCQRKTWSPNGKFATLGLVSTTNHGGWRVISLPAAVCPSSRARTREMFRIVTHHRYLCVRCWTPQSGWRDGTLIDEMAISEWVYRENRPAGRGRIGREHQETTIVGV